MQEQEPNFHYVCTLDEARRIVDEFDEYWISNCECREKRGPCQRSGLFLCLQFKEKTAAVGTGKRPATKREVLDVLTEAKETHLVPRPFRDEATKMETVGICFCCDCCCDYFAIEDHNPCDKGIFIEKTDTDLCNACGTCEDICFFGARLWDDDALEVIQDRCYGCGVCVDACPEGAIVMVGKK